MHHDKAVNIIFDMHSEYGLQARKEGNQESFVKGLKTLFPEKWLSFHSTQHQPAVAAACRC